MQILDDFAFAVRNFIEDVRSEIYTQKILTVLNENDGYYQKMLWKFHERHCAQYGEIPMLEFTLGLGLYDKDDIRLFRHKLERLNKWDGTPNPLYKYPLKRSFS